VYFTILRDLEQYLGKSNVDGGSMEILDREVNMKNSVNIFLIGWLLMARPPLSFQNLINQCRGFEVSVSQGEILFQHFPWVTSLFFLVYCPQTRH
jgi:hypothetical protein